MSEEPLADRDAGTDSPLAGIGVLEVLPVVGLGAWTLRITVAHADGPMCGWAPLTFTTAADAEGWLADRSRHQLRPAVRDCALSEGELSYAAVLDEHGTEVLVSAPLRRIKAAGVAALLAAELRVQSLR